MSNAIAISRNLVASGLTQAQAEAIAETFATQVGDNLATKADLADVKQDLKDNTGRLESDYRTDIAEVKTNLTHADARMTRIESKLDKNSLLLKIVIGGIVALLVAVLNPKLTQDAPTHQPTAAVTTTTASAYEDDTISIGMQHNF